MRRLRKRRGLSLFGALLALGLLGMLVLGATVFFETRALERRGQLAAVQLAVLAEAAASHANSRFPALLVQARRRAVRADGGRSQGGGRAAGRVLGDRTRSGAATGC